MTDWSLGEVIGVLGDVYNKTFGKVSQDQDICSNPTTLLSARFLPSDIKPTDLQRENARTQNELINVSWKDSLAGHLVEKARTYSGRLSLLLKAANPTSNQDKLEQRRKVIEFLVTHEEFAKNLKNLISAYSEKEIYLLNQFDPKGAGTKKPGRLQAALKPPIFEKYVSEKWAEKFRRSHHLITLNDAYITAYNIFTTGTKVATAAYAIWFSVSSLFESDHENEQYANLTAATAGGLPLMAQLINSEAGKLFRKVSGPIMGPELLSRAIDFGSYSWADHSVKRTMQHVMVNVVAALRQLKGLYGLVRNEEMAKHLENFDKLRNLMESEEPEVREMLELLDVATFDSNSSTGVFRGGPVLCLWDMIQSDTASQREKFDGPIKELEAQIKEAEASIESAETEEDMGAAIKSLAQAKVKLKGLKSRVPEVKRLILEAMVALGEIDGCLTLLKALEESTEESPWSLVEPYKVTQNSTFEVKDAHFPPVAANQSKRGNSLSIVVEGGSSIPHSKPLSSIKLPPIVILTAQNGAGKTTFALNWMNNILAMQSFGIAPCEEARFPIYDRIISSKGIIDSNKESSFEAVDEFVDLIKKEIKNNPDKKFFFVFDELYRETDETKGASRLIKFEKFLQKQYKKNPNFTAIFITHSKAFAEATRDEQNFTTRPGKNGPSGILEHGRYAFDT